MAFMELPGPWQMNGRKTRGEELRTGERPFKSVSRPSFFGHVDSFALVDSIFLSFSSCLKDDLGLGTGVRGRGGWQPAEL